MADTSIKFNHPIPANLPKTGIEKLREMVAENLENAPGRVYMKAAMTEALAEHDLAIIQRDKALRIARDALAAVREGV